jgi:CheY-like chemotaxis protein
MANELIADLRAVLLHWHNSAYLETHPLARRIHRQMKHSHSSGAQTLRHVLRIAIEALQPCTSLPPHSPEARPYEILCRHYIGRQSIRQVALDLNIGERQAYRELQSAVEALAQIVQKSIGDGLAGSNTQTSPKVHEEIERLAGYSHEVNLVHLLEEVGASVQLLAHARGISIRIESSASTIQVVTNRVMLRQAMLNLLSYVVQNHSGSQLVISIAQNKEAACIRLAYAPQGTHDPSQPDQPLAVSARLFQTLGASYQPIRSGSQTEFHISLPLTHENSVLIVDDNDGLITLFTRYLRHSRYRVYGASRVGEALTVLQSARPDALVVDIMMPDHDGWEFIEKVYSMVNPQPRIVVCSIINDPELALALGADAFLHKPVTSAHLLQTLDTLLA